MYCIGDSDGGRLVVVIVVLIREEGLHETDMGGMIKWSRG